MIHLQFVRGGGIGSRLIAWFSSGKLSHVDCVLPDGSLLGARSDKVGGKEPGVQIRPPAYSHWSIRDVIDIPATKAQQKRFYAFLNRQLGKPYDKIGILGFVFARDWREDDSWYCSELCAAALEHAGIMRKLYVPTYKITPEALAMVVSAIGGKVETPGS